MKQILRGWAIVAGAWSVLPWLAVVLSLLVSALFALHTGSSIHGMDSERLPGWLSWFIGVAEPCLLKLLWQAQKSREATVNLTIFIAVCLLFGAWRQSLDIVIWWSAPTLPLLPMLFWYHRRTSAV